MRIGINFAPPHDSPDQWAEILVEHGFRATSFPVDYRAPVSLIDGYVKAAKEHDLRIAEVGVWDSPHFPDPARAKAARERCLEQFRLAEYVRPTAASTCRERRETSGFTATGKTLTRPFTRRTWNSCSACATR